MKAVKWWAERAVEPLVRVLAAWGVTANTVTIGAFILNLGVAAVIVLGYEIWAGALVMVVASLDMLDGALARLTKTATPFGAFFDSNLDRYSEAVVFLGLLVLYADRGNILVVVLIYIATIGSLMVSYARARAEGLGLDCEVGLLARPERVIILGLGLLLGLTLPALAVLAVLTNVTAAQRMWHVWRRTR